MGSPKQFRYSVDENRLLQKSSEAGLNARQQGVCREALATDTAQLANASAPPAKKG